MKTLLVEDIQDNMVLADDLIAPGGNIILKAGAKLQKALGPRLASWGISTVCIDAAEEKLDDINAANNSINAEEKLAHIFRKSLNLPHMKEIQDALLIFLSENAS